MKAVSYEKKIVKEKKKKVPEEEREKFILLKNSCQKLK